MDVNELMAQARSVPEVPGNAVQIQKLRYSHQAMIEMIVAEPSIKQCELAARFGKTQSWISIIMNSDAFLVKLNERMMEVWGEHYSSITDRMKAVMDRSLQILEEKLAKPAGMVPDQLALRTAELTSRALGYGARDTPAVVVNVTQKLDDNADQLVHLLRRKKAQVLEGEAVAFNDIEG